jgi:hypothetical protein
MKIMTMELFLDVCLLQKECAGRKSTFLEITKWNKKNLANQEMVGVRCLIPSMVSAGINYCLASPPHAADEPADLVIRNLGTFLYDFMS